MKTFLVALRATAVTLVLTGLCYPLLMTGLGHFCFPAPPRAAWFTLPAEAQLGLP